MKPTHARICRRRISALLILALLVVLGALTTGAIAAGSGDSSGGGNDIQIQISECGDSSAPPSDCGPTQIVEADPVPPKPAPAKKPAPGSGAPAPKPHASEIQDYSLKTGKGTVVTDNGVSQAGTVDLDPTVKKLERPDAREPSPAPTLPTVQTNAGSPFAGFGSAFNFVSSDEALSRFAIPPFLQPIYQAAGQAYGVPWNVLASINSIETDFGRIQNQVSSAGALGWMQFMPATWKMYGVDASGDGVADPWNPVDAIYAAARYLKAAGADHDLHKAVLAYNHAGWYADTVLKTASIYGSLPSGLVAETGSLAYGRFPLRGAVSYGDDFRRAQAAGKHAAGLRIGGSEGARAIATQNVTVKQILLSRPLARILQRKHALRTRGLTSVKPAPAASPGVIATASARLLATAGSMLPALLKAPVTDVASATAARVALPSAAPAVADQGGRATHAGGLPRGYGHTRTRDLTVVVEDALHNTYRYGSLVRLRSGIHPGAKLKGGQTIGFVGTGGRSAFVFAIRAAGGAPVDPRPLIDGYRLQEAAGFQNLDSTLSTNPFVPTASMIASGSVSGSDGQLAKRVLDDPGISIYPCGRQDIEAGTVDRRVLGALLYLRESGLTLTVTSLHCGHGFYTASGNVSAHSYGAAVDIAAFNGQPVLGHQGPGSLTEQAIKLLMQLQGNAAPSQLISLMNLGGPSFALADHYSHLHVGYTFEPSLGLGRTGDALGPVTFTGGDLLGGLGSLAPEKAGRAQEAKLSDKLGTIRNPKVRHDHGSGSIKVGEGENPADLAKAERVAAQMSPLRAVPTAAGADIADIDAAARATTLAIGVVDGAGRRGWAPHQTVLLEQRSGRWAVIGPPRDRHGKIVNPGLRAVATLPGGRGYAVGDKGAVVVLSKGRPRLLRRAVKTDLLAIDARRSSGHLVAYAAGERGRMLRITGNRTAAEKAGDDTLRAVVIRDDGTVLAASSPADGHPVLYRRTGGSWSGTPADLTLPDGAGVKITALADDPKGLWAVGGITDSAMTGRGVQAPFVAQLAGGHWTTWCAGSPALTAVRELGSPTPRACDSTLSVDPASPGPAGDVAFTAKGVAVATPSGIELHGDRGFRLVPDTTAAAGAAPVVYSHLALLPNGSGWALGPHGAMVRIALSRKAPAPSLDTLDVHGSTHDLAIAAAESGHQALAVADGAASVVGGANPATAASGLNLSDVAWSDADTAWALDASTGALVRYENGQWSATGASSQTARSWSEMLVALGAGTLQRTASGDAGSGLRALGFSGDSGFAVGDHGAMQFYLNGTWLKQDAITESDLHAVAVRGERALAGGSGGTLLEPAGGSWKPSASAAELVGKRDFSAVTILSDGTELAAAAGAIIERDHDDDWRAADLQPLGLDIIKLRGYRAESGGLRVLALVRTGATTSLLDGDATGWRPVGEQIGASVSDFDLAGDSNQLWIAGRGMSGPVVAQLHSGQDGLWTGAP